MFVYLVVLKCRPLVLVLSVIRKWFFFVVRIYFEKRAAEFWFSCSRKMQNLGK